MYSYRIYIQINSGFIEMILLSFFFISVDSMRSVFLVYMLNDRNDHK
jgi:hypothetical protein